MSEDKTFKSKYKIKGDPDVTKTEISEDTYALCEQLDIMINLIKRGLKR